MAEISAPRIESISDHSSDSAAKQEQAAQNPRVKTVNTAKPAQPQVPEISSPEEEEKHDLDEMA